MNRDDKHDTNGVITDRASEPGEGTESFALANDPPRRRSWRAANVEGRQLKLLDGMECLPGQQDLFPAGE